MEQENMIKKIYCKLINPLNVGGTTQNAGFHIQVKTKNHHLQR